MKRALILALVLISAGLSAITADDAVTKAQQYLESGETVDITPQGLTYYGTTGYWVIELVGSMNKINAMLPFDSDKGDLKTSDSMKDVLKTHYLANYFATDDTIPDFLDSTLSHAEGKKTDFSNAQTQLGIYAAQLENQAPNVTLINLEPLTDSLTTANNDNDDLRDQILSTQNIVSQTTWRTTNVADARSSLNNVFTKEETFLDSLDEVATNANALLTELAGNSYLLSEHPSLVQAFQGVITSFKLTEGAPVQKRDSLTSNQNTINSFFGGLDLTASTYLEKLRGRVNNHISTQEIQAISDALSAYNANYTYIYNNADSVPPTYDDDISQLQTVITIAQNYFNQENYSEAKAQFEEIDGLVEELVSHIGDCPPVCSGGKTATSQCTCACPSGTSESDGKCVSGFSLNPALIGGLIIIIVVLVLFKYKDKIFSGGGKIEEKPNDMWADYKF